MKEIIRRIVPKSLWQKFRELRIARDVRRYRRREVEHVYCGHSLKVLIADGISESWYDKDWEKLDELQLLASGNLRQGALVFDLGAHQGVVAMIMAKMVQETGRIIAVEGTQHNCDVASENLRMNHIRNVTVHHAVVSDRDGETRFCGGLNGFVSREGLGKPFESVTIDSLIETYGVPDVIFMDIEGFEATALKGASKALALPIDWFIEIHAGCGLEEYGSNVQEVLRCFPALQYEHIAWDLDSGQKPTTLSKSVSELTNRFAFVAIHRSPDMED
jgi:FkbM family methyltransferase